MIKDTKRIQRIAEELEKQVEKLGYKKERDSIFSKKGHKIEIVQNEESVSISPFDWVYETLLEVNQYRYQLKTILDRYAQGLGPYKCYPRLHYNIEGDEEGQKILWCTIDLEKGFFFRFRPRIDEILDGARMMLDTEYQNQGNNFEYLVNELKRLSDLGFKRLKKK